jgi:hypothetical protein
MRSIDSPACLGAVQDQIVEYPSGERRRRDLLTVAAVALI